MFCQIACFVVVVLVQFSAVTCSSVCWSAFRASCAISSSRRSPHSRADRDHEPLALRCRCYCDTGLNTEKEKFIRVYAHMMRAWIIQSVQKHFGVSNTLHFHKKIWYWMFVCKEHSQRELFRACVYTWDDLEVMIFLEKKSFSFFSTELKYIRRRNEPLSFVLFWRSSAWSWLCLACGRGNDRRLKVETRLISWCIVIQIHLRKAACFIKKKKNSQNWQTTKFGWSSAWNLVSFHFCHPGKICDQVLFGCSSRLFCNLTYTFYWDVMIVGLFVLSW